MLKSVRTIDESISIIVSVYRKEVNVPSYTDMIRQALSEIKRKRKSAVKFEIIFVTNDPANIALQKVAVFPQSVPISIYTEKEHFGKAKLISKAVIHARYDIVAIMDIDLQFPKSSLIKIIRKIKNGIDVVTTYHNKKQGIDITNQYLISVQKNPHAQALIFKKSVWETVSNTDFIDSTFTIEVLHKTLEAGFAVERFDIIQDEKGIRTRFEEIKRTLTASLFVLLVKLKKVPIHIKPSNGKTMLNAGFRYNKKEFITHSTLPHKDSAIISLTWNRILFTILFFELLLLGLGFNIIFLIQIIIAFLSIIYVIDVIFNFYLIYNTINKKTEIRFEKEELEKLKDSELPVYTILCPLYKEAHMLEPFLQGIDTFEWPKSKLDVKLLFEEDDIECIEKIKYIKLPKYVQVLIVPDSQPKTKPKACNYGLAFAKGEYIVVYDAEDIPDRLQLKKAVIAFNKVDRKVVCLQAKLNYHNTHQNILTRFFTAEYSWLFDITLPGLQSLNTIIPLGGTSNHFRTADLIKLHGWDSFNVTEDADLGLRIFRSGYQTAIIDSVTLEEANSNIRNWIRQRSRWVKGYMQTYLVHTGQIIPFIKQRGIGALMLHFVVGERILFIFINPIFWVITISYFVFHGELANILERIFTPSILYLATISLIFGNYIFILGYIFGCIKREQWGLIKFIYLIPFYLLLISVAGCVALYQLLFKPYYWEKTHHGLTMVKQDKVPGFSITDIVSYVFSK